MNRSLIIIKAGSTFPDVAEKHGDFEDWVEQGLEVSEDQWVRVIDAAGGEPLPRTDSMAAVVVTGAHEMVTEASPWSVAAAEWLRGLVEKRVPILGICFGHQLLAHACGGDVDYHPRGREVGAVTVNCLAEGCQDELLGIMPREFVAYASHAQSVLKLPSQAVRLARTEFDPNHAFRVGDCAWGVQFHPEFSEVVMRCYVEKQREELAGEGKDADRIARAVGPSPAGRLLRQFARWGLWSICSFAAFVS